MPLEIDSHKARLLAGKIIGLSSRYRQGIRHVCLKERRSLLTYHLAIPGALTSSDGKG